jgi:hypothetical protein
MKGKWILGIGLALVVVAGGLATAVAAGGLAYTRGAAVVGHDKAAPAQVVTDFYDWYLGYIRGEDGLRNPLVDGAYRDCGYLTGRFEDEIDQTLASFDKGGFDPILMAQDVPERVEIGEVEISGDQASVQVQMFWGNNPTPSERTVNLALVDGRWKIDSISL